MKIVNKIAAFAILTSITLTGCSSANNAAPGSPNSTSQSTSNQGTTPKEQAAPTSANVEDGVSNLLNVANQLKKNIQSDDTSKIKENGPKLEETWKTFEDSVKPKYPDQYAAIEKYLDPTVAGSKMNPLDKKMLGKLNDQLIKTLQELQTQLSKSNK